MLKQFMKTENDNGVLCEKDNAGIDALSGSGELYPDTCTDWLHELEACPILFAAWDKKLPIGFLRELIDRWIKAGRPDFESWHEEEPFVSLLVTA